MVQYEFKGSSVDEVLGEYHTRKVEGNVSKFYEVTVAGVTGDRAPVYEVALSSALSKAGITNYDPAEHLLGVSLVAVVEEEQKVQKPQAGNPSGAAPPNRSAKSLTDRF